MQSESFLLQSPRARLQNGKFLLQSRSLRLQGHVQSLRVSSARLHVPGARFHGERSAIGRGAIASVRSLPGVGPGALLPGLPGALLPGAGARADHGAPSLDDSSVHDNAREPARFACESDELGPESQLHDNVLRMLGGAELFVGQLVIAHERLMWMRYALECDANGIALRNFSNSRSLRQPG